MNIAGLPGDVQVVVAQALATMIAENQIAPDKKEPAELAQELKKAFEELYSSC